MLFSDLLTAKNEALQPEFDKLFEEILDKQTHEGDLLLVHANGFYNEDAHTWTNIENKDPYMIGMDTIGHADFWHYKFIDNYRQQAVATVPFPEYVKQHEFSEERIKSIRELEESEAITIQLEMLVYLKIWEADLFIKKWYQLTRLSKGEPYDWHFKIAESNREKRPVTGKREEIIRLQVRDQLKNRYPGIYSAFKNAYRTQIRNAIAHSTYHLPGRYVHWNNYSENDPHAQLRITPFDEWIDLFHDTMVIYNQLSRFFIMIQNFYALTAQQHDLTFPIRMSRKDPIERTDYYLLKHRPFFNDWNFIQ